MSDLSNSASQNIVRQTFKSVEASTPTDLEVSRTNRAGCDHASACLSRRRFMQVGAISSATVLLGNVFPGNAAAELVDQETLVTYYPRHKVANLSHLIDDQPVVFNYPDDGPHTSAMLIKLGTAAGGGIGPERDVVAFNSACTHMGGDLTGDYNPVHKIAGPCIEHLTSFDLTRHGIVVAGHATQALPQIILEIEGDDIFATGIVGLVYGYHTNPTVKQGSLADETSRTEAKRR